MTTRHQTLYYRELDTFLKEIHCPIKDSNILHGFFSIIYITKPETTMSELTRLIYSEDPSKRLPKKARGDFERLLSLIWNEIRQELQELKYAPSFVKSKECRCKCQYKNWLHGVMSALNQDYNQIMVALDEAAQKDCRLDQIFLILYMCCLTTVIPVAQRDVDNKDVLEDALAEALTPQIIANPKEFIKQAVPFLRDYSNELIEGLFVYTSAPEKQDKLEDKYTDMMEPEDSFDFFKFGLFEEIPEEELEST